jgi:hypothetical protein
MATLLHEIWRETNRDGTISGYAFILAGPMGDAARDLLQPGATLIHVYEAGSVIEAGTIRNRLLDFGPYTTPWPDLDSQPYPEEWARIQRGAKSARPR